MQREIKEVTVLGQRLEVLRIGAGRAGRPVLVFLHDGLGAAGSWSDVPEHLAAATGLSALVYSRAGHGRSGPRAVPRTPAFMHVEAAVVLPALLAALGAGRPVLIGHSDGASIALVYAGLGRDAVAAIALAPHLFVEDRTIAAIARLRDRLRASPAARQRLRALHGANTDALVAEWTEVWLGAAFRTWTIEPVVAAIRCPTLVLQGDRDEFGTDAQVDRAAELLAGRVRTAILGDCDHVPHRTQRAATLGAIESFLASLEV